MLLISITGAAIFFYIVVRFIGLPEMLGKIISAVGLISGIVLAFDMGATYVLPGRPAWRTWFWPLIYAASAAVTGIFSIYIWAAIFQTRIGGAFLFGINNGALIALIVQVGTILAYLIFLNSAPIADPIKKPARLLKGAGALPFWGGVVFAGAVVPLVLTIWVQTARLVHISPLMPLVGWIGILLGGISIRAIMYTLGNEIDPIL
ncbi:MAG: hypothetical protein JRJ02_16695 [Deltaproteobacteria bacterium]|nr:hypothetical protein [Deltaproteobacteria bacterium]